MLTMFKQTPGLQNRVSKRPPSPLQDRKNTMQHPDPVQTPPKEFENAALFVRLDLPSTLIRHENGAFRKRSSNRRNLKTLAFRFCVDGKHFERSFLKTMTSR